MIDKVYGLDPSFTGFGISDGLHHDCYVSDVVRTEGSSDEDSHLYRTSKLVLAVTNFIGIPYEGEVLHLWMEAPQMRVPVHGGTHLYQLGWLMHGLYAMAAQRTLNGAGTYIHLITHGTYLKALFGNGRVPDTELSKLAYRKYGIDIADDRGLNKLDAWCIYRYGCGVRDGEWEHKPNKRDARLKVRAAKAGIPCVDTGEVQGHSDNIDGGERDR